VLYQQRTSDRAKNSPEVEGAGQDIILPLKRCGESYPLALLQTLFFRFEPQHQEIVVGTKDIDLAIYHQHFTGKCCL
jgi:hypothetical protein